MDTLVRGVSYGPPGRFEDDHGREHPAPIVYGMCPTGLGLMKLLGARRELRTQLSPGIALDDTRTELPNSQITNI